MNTKLLQEMAEKISGDPEWLDDLHCLVQQLTGIRPGPSRPLHRLLDVSEDAVRVLLRPGCLTDLSGRTVRLRHLMCRMLERQWQPALEEAVAWGYLGLPPLIAQLRQEPRPVGLLDVLGQWLHGPRGSARVVVEQDGYGIEVQVCPGLKTWMDARQDRFLQFGSGVPEKILAQLTELIGRQLCDTDSSHDLRQPLPDHAVQVTDPLDIGHAVAWIRRRNAPDLQRRLAAGEITPEFWKDYARQRVAWELPDWRLLDDLHAVDGDQLHPVPDGPDVRGIPGWGDALRQRPAARPVAGRFLAVAPDVVHRREETHVVVVDRYGFLPSRCETLQEIPEFTEVTIVHRPAESLLRCTGQ